jgi:hypothetical protein
MRLTAIIFFSLFAMLVQPAFAAAPKDTSRILHTFNFEEREQGNDEDQPMHWDKLESIDMPHYVRGRLTTDRHRNGKYSFRMDLDGGSCIYRYQPGLLRVQPNAHYRFEAYCHTTILRYARARLTAYFTDLDGHPLPATVTHSDLFCSQGDDDGWHLMSVELTADRDQATFLVIQMELLQPNLYSTSTLGQRALFLQDVHGSAWFDDMTVSQVPQVSLKTDRPGNVFRRGDPRNLFVIVNDHQTNDLSVQLVVTDADDRKLYQHTGAVDISTAKELSPGVKQLTMQLPAVPTGWYRASLEMMSNGIYVGQESMAWVQLADDGAFAPPDPRFGMVATDLPFEDWDDLPNFLPLLSVGHVKLTLWNSKMDVQQLDSSRFDRLLESLQTEGISPRGCLIELPPKIAGALNGNTWLQLLNAPADTWQTQLAFLISRHANRIDHWQIGTDDTDEFAVNPDMRRVFDKVYVQFANLLDHPDIAMPCPMLYDLPAPRPGVVTLSVPVSIIPAEIPLYLQEYEGREVPGVSLSLSLLDRHQYGRETQLRDLAQRVVYSLASNIPRVDLPMPMALHQQGDHLSPEPTEAVLVMRTLLTNLTGATFRGKMPIADDIDAFLFERGGEGIVVLWNKNDVPEGEQIVVSLGKHPVRTDLWGNSVPLQLTTPAQGEEDDETARRATSTLVQLKVGRMPIILTGIDGEMARLRASLTIDRPLIESTFQQHTRRIHFVNPYNQPIGGSLKLHAPKGWILTPSNFTFTLNAGEACDHDFTIEFPYNTVAGPKSLQADFNVQADHHFTFSEPLSVSVGLSDVGTQSMAFRDGNDILVQQLISNYGDQPINYTSFASYPGKPRIERLVSSLRPGQTAIKKFRFTNIPQGQTGKIRIGLKEVDGDRILNDEVEIR